MEQTQTKRMPTWLVLIIGFIVGILIVNFLKYLVPILEKAPPANDATLSAISASSTANQITTEGYFGKEGRKAYPFIKNNFRLNLYYFDDASIQDVDVTAGLEPYSGIGPLGLSHNEFYTAYAVGEVTNGFSVRVVDHKTLEKKTIFTSTKDQIIKGVMWSALDGKILWQIGDYTAPDPSTYGEGIGDDGTSNLRYMVYDTKTGEITTLPSSVQSLINFNDDTHYLTVNNGVFEIYNIETQSIELGKFKNVFGFLPESIKNYSDFKFSDDGTKFSVAGFSLMNQGPNNTSLMNNIYGDTLSKTFTRVTPLESFISTANISPGGNTIAYSLNTKLSTYDNKHEVYLYDVQKKTKTFISKGFPSRWLDDNRILLYEVLSPTEVANYVYYISSKQKVQMQGVDGI